MRSFYYFFCFCLLQLSCTEQSFYKEGALIITNVGIVDPIDGLTKNKTIILHEGKVFDIVSSADFKIDNRSVVIDGSGKFIIPGLWDTHVHFAYLEELAPHMFDLFLRHGVTSVRDTGGKLEFVTKYRKASLENPTKVPRMMIAGPLLDGTPNVYDGSSPRLPPLSVASNGIDHMTKNVQRLLAGNVDFLKAYEMLSPGQLQTIIELADGNNLKVTGHIPLSMDAISASNAGMDSFEHLRNLDLSCASNAAELLADRSVLLNKGLLEKGTDLRSKIHDLQREVAIAHYDDDKANEVLRILKKNNTWQIPTLALNTLFTEKYFTDADYQNSYRLLPDSIGTHWKERSKALKDYPITNFRRDYDAWNFMMVKKIHETQIPIMAGTDTPIAFLTPGLSLHTELATLVKAGLSNQAALQSATTYPAIYFNLEMELGRIKKGYLADLVLLTANPLENIGNTTKIITVIKNGEIYTPRTKK